MLKRMITVCLVAVLVAGMGLTAMLGAQATEKDVSIYELLDEFPMENINYSYIDRRQEPSTVCKASVWFSPALLLQDARVFSGEMAKSSVALAMAAYNQNYVTSLLSEMGFAYDDNSSVYDRAAGELTIDDCDYVAYTIAYQDVYYPATDETYRIYAVPIKGTTKNAEWFSNFHMGNAAEHDGFRKASMEVYNALQDHFAKEDDGIDADHRIVWLTGHSRGAACANLISGWLSSSGETYTKAEHVFAYTFACPSVSLDADTSLTNIYNFNNPGDLVPMLPLEAWDYKRYGQTVMLDTSDKQLSNLRLQFGAQAGVAYAAETTDHNYLTLLHGLVGTDREEFMDSATTQAVLSVAAWALGGNEDASLFEVLSSHLTDVPEILWEVTDCFGLKDALLSLVGVNDEFSKLIEWAQEAYEETKEMTEEEFAIFLDNNADIIADLEDASDMEIIEAASILSVRIMLQQATNEIDTVVECLQAAMNLVLDDNGEVMDKIAHAHTQITYTAWINSLYYGYRGWLGNESVEYFIPDESVLSVGDECFFRCIALESLTLNAPTIFLGNAAFGQCGGLRAVTLPVDCGMSGNPFANTGGVTQISYTYGRTGVMIDRTRDNSVLDYEDTLEYVSRDSIRRVDFAEGITHVGNYLFGGGSTSLEYVLLPTTLKTIGNNAFYECEALKDIVLHDALVGLGQYAFSGCVSLSAMPALPDSLTVIEDGVFFGCDGFTAITIPETVKRIGAFAFNGCDSVVELTLPDTVLAVGAEAFGGCDSLRTVTLPVDYDFSQQPFKGTAGVETIRYTKGQTGIQAHRTNDGGTFDFGRTLEYVSRNSIRSVDFGKGIVCVGNLLFRGGGPVLERVTLSNSVKSIGDYAFYTCPQLRDVQLHEGLVSLGGYAFFGCGSLTKMTLPDTLTAIGDFAFYGCASMAELTIPDTAVTLGKSAFGNCKALRTVTLPVNYDFSQNPFGGSSVGVYTDGVTTIHYTCGQSGVMADRMNASNQSGKPLEYISRNAIQYVDFEEGITNVAGYLFYPGSDSLTTVVLPSTLKTIDDCAFHGCKMLRNITLHEGITTLGNRAFQNCDSLKTVSIPKTVTAIGEFAFQGCDGLEELTLPDTQISLGKQAFGACHALRTVTLPVDYDISQNPFGGSSVSTTTSGVTTIHYTYGQTGTMTDRTKDSNEENYHSKTLEYASRNSIQYIDFEDGVSNIGACLFYPGSSSLTTVKLPSTLKTVGDYAFYGCTALPDMQWNEGLVSLGDHAFYNCDGLTKLTAFPDSLTTLGNSAFRGCDGLTEVVIPATVTTIGEFAFHSCSAMQALTLPDTPVALGKQAFGACHALRTVTLPVDYDISQNPFGGSSVSMYTDGVTTIHYTRGQTGTMTDRTKDSNEVNYHSKTLEYASRNSIQYIDFEEGITSIGAYLFYPGSTSLTTVKLPSTMKTIGDCAFYSCTALSDLKWNEGLVRLGSHAFYNCDSLTALPAFPDSLTTLGDSAFRECDGLTEVVIPATVTTIDELAFHGCSAMQTLTLPDTPVALGKYAFGYCEGLRTVTLPVDYDFSQNPFGGSSASSTTSGVTTVHYTCGQTGTMTDRTNDSNRADYYGKTMEYLNRNSIQYMDFAEGITNVAAYLFRSGSRSLKTVNLPATLQTIGSQAFFNCTVVPEINFCGNAPEIASDAFRSTTATCRYPGWDATWTADVMQNYAGTLTWVPYGCDPITLTGKSFTLSFEDEILVNFYFTASDLTHVTELGMLVFYTDPGTADMAAADDVYSVAYDPASGRYMGQTHGIAAKKMGDTRYYAAYAKRADGTCDYSKVYDYSPKKYAMNMLGKDTTSAKQKALCVAMLNYGAAAQEYFGYNQDGLMNSELTDGQKELVVSYDKTLFTGAVPADPDKIGAFAATTGFSKKSVTVSFEGAFAINYYFTPNTAVDGDMILYIWTPEAYATAATLTADNAKTITMAAGSDGRYWAQVGAIAAKDLDKTYYVAGVYTDADGNTCCTGVIAYSLSKYCLNKAVDGNNMRQLAAATAMYGYYAKEYFA